MPTPAHPLPIASPTFNVNPTVSVFNPFRRKDQLHPPIGFSYCPVAAVLWHLLGAAVMDVQATICALLPLVDDAVEHSTTVLTPSRLVVGGALEVVRIVLLSQQ